MRKAERFVHNSAMREQAGFPSGPVGLTQSKTRTAGARPPLESLATWPDQRQLKSASDDNWNPPV